MTALIESTTASHVEKLVTFRVCGQLFGLPATRVRDVLRPTSMMRVPLAKPYVAGAMNLRGHIVTAINLKAKLGLPTSADGGRTMCLVIENQGELIAFLVDMIGDVMDVDTASIAANPASLNESWTVFSRGIVRLKDELLVLLKDEQLLAAAA